MFAVDDASIAAVRQAFEESGELAAAVELRRRFPGISELARAREIVRLMVTWQPPSRRNPAKSC